MTAAAALPGPGAQPAVVTLWSRRYVGELSRLVFLERAGASGRDELLCWASELLPDHNPPKVLEDLALLKRAIKTDVGRALLELLPAQEAAR